MDSFIQDQIYKFLFSAFNYNSDPTRRFFFDRGDNLFFSLTFENERYMIFFGRPYQDLSETDRRRIMSKIQKIEQLSGDIVELHPFNNGFYFDRSAPAKDKEEGDRRFKLEHELFQRIKDFLEANNIDVEKSHLIF